MSKYPAALILLALVGCKSAPEVIESAPAVVRVPVTQYVPVPSALTKACPVAELDDRSVESVVRAANARKLALEQCNAQLREIRGLGEP